jgi:CHAT domain-containing protein
VETTSARVLTSDLMQRQAVDATLNRAKALQQTLNFMIEEGVLKDPTTGRVVFSDAHPIFWAPFTLVGGGLAGRRPADIAAGRPP